jgi:septal ring factor EnvC (AmiA/AmiB activator)
MDRVQVIVFAALYATLALCADACASQPSPQQPTQAAASSLHKVERRVQRDRSEVHRLQRDVAAQEAHSQRATQRLQQQDQAISRLRKELEALQARQAAGQQ